MTRQKRSYTWVSNVVNDFRESDERILIVDEYDQANANSCRNSFRSCIKRDKLTNLDVFVRKGVVYLIKKRI